MCPRVWSAQNCCSVSWALPVICSAAPAAGSLPLDFTGNEYLEENSPAAWREPCWKSRMKVCPGFLPMEVIKGHCLPWALPIPSTGISAENRTCPSYSPDVWLSPQFSSINFFFSATLLKESLHLNFKKKTFISYLRRIALVCFLTELPHLRQKLSGKRYF